MFWPQLKATVLTVIKKHCGLSNNLLFNHTVIEMVQGVEVPMFSLLQQQSVTGCAVWFQVFTIDPCLVQRISVRICHLNTLSHFNWVLGCAEEQYEKICSLVHSFIEHIRLFTLCMFGISKLCHLLLLCLDESERKIFTDFSALFFFSCWDDLTTFTK